MKEKKDGKLKEKQKEAPVIEKQKKMRAKTKGGAK